MDNNRGIEFLAGFVLGGLVGAATALLLAHASGEETREQIRARSSELKNRGEALGDDANVQMHKVTREGQKRISDIQERAGLALEEQKARVAEAIDAGKQAASQRNGERMDRFEANKAPKAPA